MPDDALLSGGEGTSALAESHGVYTGEGEEERLSERPDYPGGEELKEN